MLRARAGLRAALLGAGLAVGTGVLAGAGVGAWWVVGEHRHALVDARRTQVATVGRLLQEAAAAHVASGDLPGLRRLMADSSARYRLSVARVELPDGTPIADGDPAARVSDVPAEWPRAGAIAPPASAAGVESYLGTAEARGRGMVVVRVEGASGDASWAGTPARVGAAGLAGAGVVSLLGASWLGRRRLRALLPVGEALEAAAAGERSAEALRVEETRWPGSRAWNALLEEREAARVAGVRQRSAERRAVSGAGGDLAGACDAMSQGMVLVDDKGRIKYANGAAAVFLRVKREDLAGADLGALAGDPQVADAVRGVSAGTLRHRVSVERERTGEQGAGVLRWSVRPVRRDDSAAAVIIIEDVTQQRVADEARNSFVTQATHELRTPLTNIRLYAEMLADEGEPDPRVRAQCVNVINHESRRLERIVQDMLSVAEIEAGSFKLRVDDVRPEELFAELRADYEAQAKDKDIALEFVAPPKWPVLKGDRDKVVLALHNLVGNALKYTPSGGAVRVVAREEGARLIVDVIDNGIGIREEECERVFERFYRARDKRVAGITGSGLGLTLARQVVRMHGGDVTCRSQVDKGSTFTMTLPLSPQPAVAEAPASGPGAGPVPGAVSGAVPGAGQAPRARAA